MEALSYKVKRNKSTVGENFTFQNYFLHLNIKFVVLTQAILLLRATYLHVHSCNLSVLFAIILKLKAKLGLLTASMLLREA